MDEIRPDLRRWLPVTKKETDLRRWTDVDVVLISGDAYVDHPSFGTAIIGRVIEAEGLRVAIIPQPDWHGDLRDFRKFGAPRLFFAVTSGVMDSMVNHYTAGRRLRHDDAYTPDGRHGARPDRAVTVYTRILKELYPDTPVIIGGIEASLRRLAHYDYWDDRYHPSILADSGADLLVYGMGEKPLRAICRVFSQGGTIEDCKHVAQTAYLADRFVDDDTTLRLPSFEQCAGDKKTAIQTFAQIERESNKLNTTHIVQRTGERDVVVNPPFAPMTQEELDRVYALPFTRLPHPKYAGKRIPAFDMIRWSVNTHRGCWGGCAFCTISMHQGKFIVSRSRQSIVNEVKAITADPDFKGYLSDLGGPSANMYMMRGRDEELCRRCHRPSCAFPEICQNMNTDHTPLLELYKSVDALPGIKKSFISSGVRYDVAMHQTGDKTHDQANRQYIEELIRYHVSGRLKVAPEHTEDRVLQVMRKPSFGLFFRFKELFDQINNRYNLRQQLIPYFISSHPGCRMEDMQALQRITRGLNFHLEQVQDFTPTPMTLATELFYAGVEPKSGQQIYVARSMREKEAQKSLFFWYVKSDGPKPQQKSDSRKPQKPREAQPQRPKNRKPRS